MEQVFVALGAGVPEPLKIISENKANGTLVVEHPVLSTGRIDLSLTHNRNAGAWDVTDATLEEIAANFKAWPWPVNVYPSPHRKLEDQHGAADGFVDSLSVRKGKLIARCELSGWLAQQVKSGKWRGFSGDFVKDPQLATGQHKGWCMWGGIYTNKPATDTNFKLESGSAAASAEWTADETFCIALELDTSESSEGDSNMAKTLEELALDIASLEAKLKEATDKVTSLSEENEKLKNDVVTANRVAQEKMSLASTFEPTIQERDSRIRTLEASLASANSTIERNTAEMRTLSANLETEKNANLRRDISGRITAALQSGVPAKAFEGASEDVLGWYNARFKSIEGLDTFIKAFPTDPNARTTRVAASSGSGTDFDDAVSLSAEDREKVASAIGGADPRFAGCASVADFRKRLNKDKK